MKSTELEAQAELEALDCRHPHASFITLPAYHPGFLGGGSGKKKNLPANAGDTRDMCSIPGSGTSRDTRIPITQTYAARQ